MKNSAAIEIQYLLCTPCNPTEDFFRTKCIFQRFLQRQNQYDVLNTHAKHGPTMIIFVSTRTQEPTEAIQETLKELLHEGANSFELHVKEGIIIEP